MKEISKAPNNHMDKFQESAANIIKQSINIVHPSGFSKPVHVATRSFRKTFRDCTIVASSKIGRIRRVFMEAFKS
jgi:hypothetical protein